MRRKRKKSKQITGKKDSLTEGTYKVVAEFLQGKERPPLSIQEIGTKLSFSKEQRSCLADVLRTLLKEGKVQRKERKYTWTSSAKQAITGIIRIHPRGFGFLQCDPPAPFTQDVFIPKKEINHAIDGDRVEVLVKPDSNRSEKGPEGKITQILTRGRSHIAGVITYVAPEGTALAYAPLLQEGQEVTVKKTSKISLSIGDRVYLKIEKWGSKEKSTIAHVEKKIGALSDPKADISATLYEYELPQTFPKPVTDEARSFSTRIPASEIAKRRDLRKQTTFTIDPTTAKDFDDAVSLKKDRRGHYFLDVHIADVSHYVTPGSPLDLEAKRRCNSTYLPNYCLPMLPPVLSEGLCSLKPNVNRLVATVSMEFDKAGTLVHHEIFRSVIKSDKRFTYREAKEVLDGKKKSPHKKALEEMVKLCHLLKGKRAERGSIEFGLPDLRVLVDKEGVPTGTEYIEYDITHQLIEEFMLKTNEVIALHMTKSKKPVPYRIHDEPTEENLREFIILASQFGFHLPENPTPQQLQKLFDEALTTSYGPFLAIHFIRKMRMAVYSPDNIGHWGLSLSHYCHFTSPIRRYIDLVIHRSLFEKPETKENLEVLSTLCSEKERISARAENSVFLLKKLRLLDALHKEDPHKTFTAVVTGIKPFGFSFEVTDFLLGGFLHVSELDNDYFSFDRKSDSLKGTYSDSVYKCGDRITLMVKRVDLLLQQCAWAFVSTDSPSKKKKIRGKK